MPHVIKYKFMNDLASVVDNRIKFGNVKAAIMVKSGSIMDKVRRLLFAILVVYGFISCPLFRYLDKLED